MSLWNGGPRTDELPFKALTDAELERVASEVASLPPQAPSKDLEEQLSPFRTKPNEETWTQELD